MPKYGYIVVEGPHDVEFLCRVVYGAGLRRVRLQSHLDPFLHKLIPEKFPPDGDLLKRVPVPLFLQSESHAVAIHSAVGDTRLVQTIEETGFLLSKEKFTGIAVTMDADSEKPPAERYQAIRDGLRAKGFAMPEAAGEVTSGAPRLGGFVLPDCRTSGTLETILMECAQHAYPTLLRSATAHVDAALQDGSLTPEDVRDIGKPAGRAKAIVSSISSVLKPGRAIQVSIQDNRWLKGETLELPAVKAFREFLDDLLELN